MCEQVMGWVEEGAARERGTNRRSWREGLVVWAACSLFYALMIRCMVEGGRAESECRLWVGVGFGMGEAVSVCGR